MHLYYVSSLSLSLSLSLSGWKGLECHFSLQSSSPMKSLAWVLHSWLPVGSLGLIGSVAFSSLYLSVKSFMVYCFVICDFLFLLGCNVFVYYVYGLRRFLFLYILCYIRV